MQEQCWGWMVHKRVQGVGGERVGARLSEQAAGKSAGQVLLLGRRRCPVACCSPKPNGPAMIPDCRCQLSILAGILASWRLAGSLHW